MVRDLIASEGPVALGYALVILALLAGLTLVVLTDDRARELRAHNRRVRQARRAHRRYTTATQEPRR